MHHPRLVHINHAHFTVHAVDRFQVGATSIGARNALNYPSSSLLTKQHVDSTIQCSTIGCYFKCSTVVIFYSMIWMYLWQILLQHRYCCTLTVHGSHMLIKIPTFECSMLETVQIWSHMWNQNVAPHWMVARVTMHWWATHLASRFPHWMQCTLTRAQDATIDSPQKFVSYHHATCHSVQSRMQSKCPR